jgi:hypothetical protein
LQVACPKCRSTRRIKPQEGDSGGLGCALLLFGGLLPLLLFADYQRNRMICLECGHSFRRPSLPWSGTAKVVAWSYFLLLLPLILVISVISLGFSSEATAWVKLDVLESYIKDFPNVFLAMALSQLVTLTTFSLLVILISNHSHRKKLEQIVVLKQSVKSEKDHDLKNSNNPKYKKIEQDTPFNGG